VPIDQALNSELIELYRELARATREAAPPPKGTVDEAVLERWRAGRNDVERIKTRIEAITGKR
jgi:hypothetical protein